MTLRAALFTDEYEALGAWTGKSRDRLVGEEGHQDGQRDLWLAWDDGKIVGAVRPWLRPDGKVVLFFSRCVPDAYPVLMGQISGECYTTVNGADTSLLRHLEELGFQVERTEYLYEIPVTLVDAPTPAGLEIISAADTELEKLMALDCELREDVPGAAGWQPDPVWFREETYDAPDFDPEAYLVAVDREQEYVGLVRIWNGVRPLPRLGLIGVLPAHRRRGLAKCLISQAFAALHARGSSVVTAEVDAANVASNTLMSEFGGRVTGSELELRRHGEVID